MKDIDTKIIKVDSLRPDIKLIREGAELIKGGKLIAFPTETVYGLGANGLDPKAVANIFIAKGRPQDNPLILHVNSIAQVEELVMDISEGSRKLMERFWPGPLTLLFKKNHKVPNIITAGLDTVAIRMPNHPVAFKLIEISGVPIAAPSANRSGRPSPTMANHVIEDLSGRIDMIIDGGPTGVGLESTVLDMTSEPPIILRPGGIILEDLHGLVPEIVEDLNTIQYDEDMIPKSPGQKYRHYAPKARLILFIGGVDSMVESISRYRDSYISEGKKVGIMATDETMDAYEENIVISMGSREDNRTIAHNLFNTIRTLDSKGVDIILCEGMEMAGMGTAIMNRLKRAATGNIIRVGE
ncbi:MAG: threonylcarbamoyl-AMP synthase [Tissierellia bacterium]|nr:threonylcarbamoyl-AMP synthase [Tissierellia bacterium]